MGRVHAMVLTAPGILEPQDFARPTVTAFDGLLEVEANGVCGTDVHFRASAQDVPRILGHEVVGRIVEIGDVARQRWGVDVGDRVAVEAGVACGSCFDCLRGFSQTCSGKLGYGSNVTIDVAPALWGGLAEFMYLAPGTVVTRIPESVPAETAAGWFSPLVNAVDWTGPVGGDVQTGDVVVVIGPGPQGLSACLAAKARGAALVVLAGLERDARRLEAGQALGADITVRSDREDLEAAVGAATQGAMADVVIDVSGSVHIATRAPYLVRRRGTVVAASPLSAESDVPVPLRHMVWNQIRWQGVLSNRPLSTPGAAILLERHAPFLGTLVTHRFGLDEADLAIDAVAGRTPEQPVKVVVCPHLRTS